MSFKSKLYFYSIALFFPLTNLAQIIEVDLKVRNISHEVNSKTYDDPRIVSVRFLKSSDIVPIDRIGEYIVGVQFETTASELTVGRLIRAVFFIKPDRNEMWSELKAEERNVVFHHIEGTHQQLSELFFDNQIWRVEYSLSVFIKYDYFKSNFFVELGGTGLWGSINYEHQITRRPGLNMRVGVGFYTEGDFYVTIPVAVNYLIPMKEKSSFFEVGCGYTLASMVGWPDQLHFLTPQIGFRRYYSNSVLLRFTGTPMVHLKVPEFSDGWPVIPWLGFSIGKGL